MWRKLPEGCFIQRNDEEYFTHDKFGIRCFASKRFGSSFLTAIARIRNSFAQALKEVVTPVPKLVFFMLEDDVIKELGDQDGLPHLYGRCIEWLYHEVRKLVAAHLDALPNNAKREPYLVWILPTRHMNYANDAKRELFADCLQNIAEVNDVRNLALPLKQNWDQYDPSIFMFDSQRYSASGLDRLWKAFDRTVWYANILITKNENKKPGENNPQRNSVTAGGSRGRFIKRNFTSGQNPPGYYANKRKFSKYGKNTKMFKLPDPDKKKST